MEFFLADINKYYDPADVEGYETFIGPDGEYYKVKTKYESSDNLTHYKWAEEYLKRNNYMHMMEVNNVKMNSKTPLEFLIDFFGFIRYTHAHASSRKVYLTLPNTMRYGYVYSKEQIDSLYRLIKYNNDTLDEGLIEVIEDHKNASQNIADEYYNKLKSRR